MQRMELIQAQYKFRIGAILHNLPKPPPQYQPDPVSGSLLEPLDDFLLPEPLVDHWSEPSTEVSSQATIEVVTLVDNDAIEELVWCPGSLSAPSLSPELLMSPVASPEFWFRPRRYSYIFEVHDERGSYYE